MHRETVGRELKLSKPAKVTTGSESEADSKPAKVTTGSEGRSRSQCEEWRMIITESLQAGLSARRIFQDMRGEHGYTGGYESVKRFVRALSSVAPLPFRRIETAPGEEIQVDFGQGAPVIDAAGKRRRPHLFRATLSFSRKGYSEVVSRQDTETFLRCLENAFRRFGGVPKSVIPDIYHEPTHHDSKTTQTLRHGTHAGTQTAGGGSQPAQPSGVPATHPPG